MRDITLRLLNKKGVHIPHCNCAKISKVYKLSYEEFIELEKMKESYDSNGIENFFLSGFGYLHSCGITVIPDDDKLYPIRDFHVLIFAPHTHKLGQVLLVTIDQYVFEFVLKFRCKKLFVGECTNALYAVYGLLIKDMKSA